ncbi:sigma-70 family RNA polymerase sigma factor [Kitasatospora sp. NPDC089509]|uniref:sigma-70 family RNA polymerase sigma factor n=1 Tax=Kitasatospora sp. NPDC089509 TaxID=3364079 RepID=UPI00380EC085
MTSRTRTDSGTGFAGGPGSAVEDLPRLLPRVARGDETAFEAVYRGVAGPVYGVALRMLRSPAHAEEVTQEVLLEVWRTAAAYRPDRGSVLTWVLTIAHHRTVDRVRSARASAERDRQAGSRERSQGDPPEEQAVRSLEGQLVRSALAHLSAAQREAVVLAYYGGYTQREIAHRVGVPLGTVKTRIRDGLIRLRTAITPEGDRPAPGAPGAPGRPRTGVASGSGRVAGAWR